MKLYYLAAGLAVVLASPAATQLKPYQDYMVSDSVSNVSTIKVKENMVEDYLQGLRNTWAPSNDAAIKLGQMKSYNIYVSDLANSGEFNVMLVTTFANTNDLVLLRLRPVSDRLSLATVALLSPLVPVSTVVLDDEH